MKENTTPDTKYRSCDTNIARPAEEWHPTCPSWCARDHGTPCPGDGTEHISGYVTIESGAGIGESDSIDVALAMREEVDGQTETRVRVGDVFLTPVQTEHLNSILRTMGIAAAGGQDDPARCIIPTDLPCPSWCIKPAGHDLGDSTHLTMVGDYIRNHRSHSYLDGAVVVEACERLSDIKDGHPVTTLEPPAVDMYLTGEQADPANVRELAGALTQAAAEVEAMCSPAC